MGWDDLENAATVLESVPESSQKDMKHEKINAKICSAQEYIAVSKKIVLTMSQLIGHLNYHNELLDT